MTHLFEMIHRRREIPCRFGLCLAVLLCLFPLTQSSAEDAPPADAAGDVSIDDQEVLAGHSYHGEVFNEGPRQKAYLMQGTGNVHFPISTKNEEVQKFFDQGIGQLHGFWHFEAERSFRHAAFLDPDCAMTYWGAAVANLRNGKRSKGFIEEAKKRKKNADAHEIMYIDALDAYIKVDRADKSKRQARNDAYTKALEDIILEYPSDLEAKAVLALHLYSSRNASTSYFAVDALIEDILAVEPNHPVHHYRIHLWDKRNPEKALSSAALCGQASPAIAHMWHMPGHIYSRLKRYDDAAWQQEASARVDHAHMMRDRVMPDEISNFAHNNEWLIRNLIYVGRANDAIALAKNMIQLPRHPRYNTLSRKRSAYYGRLRLFRTLRTYELWNDMIQLANSAYLEPTTSEAEQANRLRYLGLAYFKTGELKNGDLQLAELERMLSELKAKQQRAVDRAEKKAKDEGKSKKQIDQAMAAARKKYVTRLRTAEDHVNALTGHLAVAEGDYEVGYDLLKKAGGSDPMQLAQVQWLAGKEEQALKAMRKYVRSHRNQVQPLAILADTLWQADETDEVEKAFEDLRRISNSIDLDMPIFTRLAPIAKALGYDQDWRIVKSAAHDVGIRPDLDTLGPMRWQPSPAPSWVLPDANGRLHSSTELTDQPHVLIFYLGYSCLHCAEQLQAFAPKAEDFAAAGLSLRAISTDDQKGLKISIDNYGDGEMPIPLVADPDLKIFKAYRVFDDFENQPLHGTFVIDADGQVLWQDISYQPFMDPQFVIDEALRLMQQRASAGTVADTTATGP